MSTDDPTHTSTAGASEANGAPLDDEPLLAQFWLQRLKADLLGLLAARPIHGRLDEADSSYFFEGLPLIQTDLEFDAVAIYEGDPSARNVLEVVRTFSGFVATCAYR